MSIGNDPSPTTPTPLASYAVWDRPTRWLHWINALLALFVVGMGLLFMFMSDLHISGKDAKFSIMRTHVLLGYCLALGVCARIFWGFRGNRYVRWRSILPNAKTPQDALLEASAIVNNRPYRHDLGHGPLGRLSTTFMLALFLTMFASGSLQAAADLHHPPLWTAISAYVAKPGSSRPPTDLGDKEMVDASKTARVFLLRKVAVRVHSIAANVLIGLLVLHVVGVSLKEIRHGGGLLSSMITGRKVFASPPTDSDG